MFFVYSILLVMKTTKEYTMMVFIMDFFRFPEEASALSKTSSRLEKNNGQR